MKCRFQSICGASSCDTWYVTERIVIPLQIIQIIVTESSKLCLESLQPINSIKSQVLGGRPDLPDLEFSLRRY